MSSLINICDSQIRVQGRLVRIARLEADVYHYLEDPGKLVEGLRHCDSRIDIFTFMQRLPETEPKYSYPMEWDNLAALPISTFDDWWKQQIDSKTRNMVRKAEKKGIVIQEVPFDEALVRGIWEIYNECPVRQGAPNLHYGKDLDTVRRMSSTFLASSTFIGAYLEGRLIGFIKLVRDSTHTQAGMMNIVSMVQHRDKAPTNALIAQAVRCCVERGISYLVYARFAYGKKQHDSLSDFKARNGFRQVALPRYYVPLTPVGRMAYRVGLHHRFVDHIPELVATRLRAFRSAWYNRKAQSFTEAL